MSALKFVFNSLSVSVPDEMTTSWPTCDACESTVAKLSNTLLLNWTTSCPDPDPAEKPWIVEFPKCEEKTNVSLRLLLLL